MEQLRSDDPSVRETAIEALQEAADAASVDLLTGVLERDPDEALRKRAAWALEAIGSRRAIPALLAKAGSRDIVDVRYSAAAALGVIGDPAAARGLIALWEREDDRDDGVVNLEAFASLVKIGRPAVPALVAAFRSDSWNVRFYAALTLGRIGGPEARRALEAQRRDPSAAVRSNVESALERLR